MEETKDDRGALVINRILSDFKLIRLAIEEWKEEYCTH